MRAVRATGGTQLATRQEEHVGSLGLPLGRRSPRGRLRWYVAHVHEGQEQAVCEKVLRLVPHTLLDDAFPLRKERWFKRRGVWRLDIVTAYQGYVFLLSRDVAGLARALAKLTLPLELVGANGRDYAPLSDEAAAWYAHMLDGAHVVRSSVGVIQDGVLHVTEGPLKGQEAQVVDVNRHKRAAWVRIGEGRGSFTEQVALDVPFKS